MACKGGAHKSCRAPPTHSGTPGGALDASRLQRHPRKGDLDTPRQLVPMSATQRIPETWASLRTHAKVPSPPPTHLVLQVLVSPGLLVPGHRSTDLVLFPPSPPPQLLSGEQAVGGILLMRRGVTGGIITESTCLQLRPPAHGPQHAFLSPTPGPACMCETSSGLMDNKFPITCIRRTSTSLVVGSTMPSARWTSLTQQEFGGQAYSA